MTRSEIIRFLVIRTIGNLLLIFSLFGVVATFGPLFYYEVVYYLGQWRGVHYVVPESVTTPFGELIVTNQRERLAFGGGLGSVLAGPKEQILIPKDPGFSLLIPKIGASSRVFPNVDASNEEEFLPVLQQGVAHAKGTVFPGIKGNSYLFAHSTDNFWDVGRYNAVFYLLKDLQPGDDIVVFFENLRHNYKVVGSQVADPSEVSHLVRSQESSQERLILQTCWPPGTTWKRLLVVAQPK